MGKELSTYVVKITIVTPWCSVNATLTWYSMKIVLNHQDKKRGLDPISMRMSQWYNEPICGGNDSQPIAFTRMNEDSSGPKKSQYQIPRPVVKDEERLARRKDDLPPPLQRRVNNPRIRDLPAFTEFYLITDKIHHATSEDAYAQAVQLQSVHVPAINKDNRWKR